MTAIVRYLSTTLLLSQRYLAPVLVFTGLVTVLTSSDAGPLTATYGASAGAMLLAATWLTTTLVGLEDRAHRAVLVVNAGDPRRVLLGSVCTAVLWCLPLTAAGLVLPLLVGTHRPTGADLLLGTEAQLTCAVTGTAVGLLCSRLVFRRQGHALLTALGLLLGLTVAKGLPPVNVLLSDLATTPRSADLLTSGAGLLALAAGLLAGAAALAHAVHARRS
ncbi:hypothetical protein [Kitasatospora sp. A2-31]|uniref:hypothetical protein n=1 Tax=Kitasatospora sp. A2-31 TaxID=2916414 RepID=UPI001EE9D8DD|nr:hypothetical protein [Kitasatospora sp. A2-31]MCG6498460.1 hypothetical protein [Kitasatospora sp. A2-31]